MVMSVTECFSHVLDRRLPVPAQRMEQTINKITNKITVLTHKEPAPQDTAVVNSGQKGFKVKSIKDEILVRRVAEHADEQAISELYDRYAALIYTMGLRYLNDRSLAEDLVQDVFTAVWRNASSFDPSRASLTTWIYRIARNRATDLNRRRQTRPKTTPGNELLETLPGDGHTDHLATSFDVAEALSLLSPAHREVLVLAYFKGLSQSEISCYTGIPLGTVKSRTTAALRALRSAMNPTGGERR